MPPKRGIPRCFNPRLLYSCLLIAFSQVNFGLDQGAFSNTQAMSYFVQMFGTYNPSTKTYALGTVYLSLLNSVNYVGFAFGLVTGNLLSGRFGRKKALFVMCFWAILAAVVLVTARHGTQMIVGRTLAYVYIGMELALVPVTQSELVPAEVRGLVVGTYQSGLMVSLSCPHYFSCDVLVADSLARPTPHVSHLPRHQRDPKPRVVAHPAGAVFCDSVDPGRWSVVGSRGEFHVFFSAWCFANQI